MKTDAKAPPQAPDSMPAPPETASPTAEPEEQDLQVSMLAPSQMKEIIRLHEMGYGTRRIAKMIGVCRKTVRRLLMKLGRLESPSRPEPPGAASSKLDPFRDLIKEKVERQLTNTRILREIRAQGYEGGISILANYARTLRVQPPPTQKKVWRRFETPPGEETQFDWSPYRIPVGGVLTVVHAFAATLGFSRRSHVHFYPDEREATLLEAHVRTFEDFRGVTRRGVYDRMATVVLGTIGKDREPLWNPRFQDFTVHYGYTPFLCQVRDPDRKGKDERFFWYLERDFLRGSEFESFDDLNAKARLWLDEVANRRVHGTTRRVPMEAWEEERPYLIALPESRFPAYDEEVRDVGPDAVVNVRGTSYTVPARLAHGTACVRLYSDHFEVCDPRGEVAFSRRYASPAEHGKLIIDRMHYEGGRRRSTLPGGSVAQLEEALLTRFAGLDELVAGIRRRMKALSHVHLRALWRLADKYGDAAFAEAATRAQTYRRYDAKAVQRILEREHPLPDEEPDTPLSAAARVLLTLGDVDGGSLDDYAHLDASEPTTNNNDDSSDDE